MLRRKLGSRGARLGVERLEEKTLLAGDVTVVVENGDLRITGDSQDNSVAVIATEIFGRYLVVGEDGTRINGRLDDEIFVRGVNDDIRIDLKGGNSEIAVLPLEIDEGEGDIRIVDLVVPDDLVIHNRSGRIDVLVQDTEVLDDLRIHTRDGADEIVVLETEVGDDLDIQANGGHDDVFLDAVLVHDDAVPDLGEGVNFLSIDETIIRDDFTVIGGHNRIGDSILVRETLIGDDVRIYAHDGNDEVCFFDVEARTLHIHMGKGNDRLDLGEVLSRDETRLNGDDGFDSFGETATILRDLSIRTFEDFDVFVDCFEIPGVPEPAPLGGRGALLGSGSLSSGSRAF